jgi:2-oxoisovalerate dehydrogenase E2 component (dihydrolipoyl transacylase)
MSETKLFRLPDLGEGLPDAEIVEWHAKVGDTVRLDEPLVSMETAKAIVEVPAPCSGTLLRIAGNAGDVIETGAVLAEFELDASLPQRAEAQDTGHHHGAPAAPSSASAASTKGAGTPVPAEHTRDDGNALTVNASDDGGEIASQEAKPANTSPGDGAPPTTSDTDAEREDAGTVVGAMQAGSGVRSEQSVSIGGVKAMPAVRALAKKLGVDLARVTATGPDGVATLQDVKRAAESGDSGRPGSTLTSSSRVDGKSVSTAGRESHPALDTDDPIRGVRRNMIRVMAAAHAEVVPTTLMDDADIHAWQKGEDVMARLIRGLVVASAAEPALNAWFKAKEGTLRRHARVDVGIAVDGSEGLFVPALRDCGRRDAKDIRAELNRLRDGVRDRSLAPEELRDYTISLSNFGVFAGKYATPVVVPPCVAIIGAGRLFHAVVPVLGGLETHRMLPLSLTFDHRAATGGEAARFLRALIDDLQRTR